MSTSIRNSLHRISVICLFVVLSVPAISGASTVMAQPKTIPENSPVNPAPLEASKVSFVEVANGLTRPVFITHAGDDSGRLFIIEQDGYIRILKNGSLLAAPFLDLHTDVKTTDNEQGLLALAFHPSYSSNGFFFVAYTAPKDGDDTGSDLVLRRYSVSGNNPDLANPNSGLTLMTISHPDNGNHNGGTLAFGADGYLYWSTGDGGSGGDPLNNAQQLNNLLGKILRIDVNSGSPYGIPTSNPFYSSNDPNIKKEIWAYGLRNPWRISFDRLTHDLYIGDVGQSNREEVDFQAASSTGRENYGWRVMEGSLCYNPSSGCDQSGKVLPVAEYSHSLGCSITGGHVYRGSNFPSLTGFYFYGDYCSGRVFSLIDDPTLGWLSAQIADTSYSISTFGEDEQGELYLASLGSGRIYNIQYQDPPIVISSLRAGNNPTGAANVNFTVNFSQPVTGVNTGDFSLTTSGVSGAAVSGVSGSGSAYTVSVNTGNGNGTLRLNVIDDDTVKNAALIPLGGTGAGNGSFTSGEVYTIDHTPPLVNSITRTNANPTSAASVDFNLTFSESVTGVDAGDFSLTTNGVSGAAVSGISGSGSAYTVTVSTGGGNGTIRLDVADDDSIKDTALNPLGGSGTGNGNFTSGEEYIIIDQIPPSVTSITRVDSHPTHLANVAFTITFSEFVTGVDTGDFNLISSGVTGASITDLTGSGSTYTVTVNTGAGNGSIRLILVDNDTIQDTASNPLTSGFTGGETYLVIKSPSFADVPLDYWAWGFIERLYDAEITGGCSVDPLEYCPDDPVTRAQMAVFLLRGIHGADYAPPTVGTSTGFSDVTIDHWAGAWIKQLAAEAITGGCGSGLYCPEDSVTRAQMAVFLLKSIHGASYSPLNVNPTFGDTSGHWAGDWIEQLAVEGITSGCALGLYCPENPVTRAQMAVFLVKAFNLP